MAGRPSIKEDINVEQVKKLARYQWPIHQIADFFGVGRAAMSVHFGAEIAQARLEGRAKIWDTMWEKAKYSDKIFLHLADRVLGPIPKLHREITKEEAIEVLENELKREGTQDSPVIEEVAHAIEEPDLNF